MSVNRYELSLHPDYVGSWGVVEALRELFQNILDQQAQKGLDSEWFYLYNPETRELSMGNKNSFLDIRSLLMGCTSKSDDAATIGKFGEGYKLAFLVLARMDSVEVCVHTGSDVWTPSLIDSPRYGCKQLVVDVSCLDKAPERNLKIIVTGVSPEDHQKFVDNNLHLKKGVKFDDTEYGRILESDEERGRIYVNGLFVCQIDGMRQGYDVKPKFLELDRDRRIASEFNVHWSASQMLADQGDIKKLVSMLSHNTEARYVKNHCTQHLANDIYADFVGTNGENAIPVSSENERKLVIHNFADAKPVVTTPQLKDVIEISGDFNQRVESMEIVDDVSDLDDSPASQLKKWLRDHGSYLAEDAAEDFRGLMLKSLEWGVKIREEFALGTPQFQPPAISVPASDVKKTDLPLVEVNGKFYRQSDCRPGGGIYDGSLWVRNPEKVNLLA